MTGDDMRERIGNEGNAAQGQEGYRPDRRRFLTGLVGLAGVLVGYGLRPSQEQTGPAPYPFTKAELDAMTRNQYEVAIDPNNKRNMMYYHLDFNTDGQPKPRRINTYLSIDGGQSWAALGRPIANGVNKDPKTVVVGGSFGGQSTNVQTHAAGEMLQMTYRNGEQVTVQLGVASPNGIETIDIESKNMATIQPHTPEKWSQDGQGNYIYELVGTDTQGQPITLIVNEVSGK